MNKAKEMIMNLWFALLAPVMVCGGFVLWVWGLCWEEIETRNPKLGTRQRWPALGLIVLGTFLIVLPFALLGADLPWPGGHGGLAVTEPNPIDDLVNGLIGRYGWLSQVIMIVGVLRVVMKPAMSAWRAQVESTSSTEDDAQLARVEHSKLYQVIAYLLDWGGSVKVGPRKDLK